MDEEFSHALLALLPRFLGTLPDAELAAFAARLQRVRVGSGTLLYRQGDVSDCMHFVVTGRLEVWVRDGHGDRRLVAQLSSGDCVGVLAILTGDTQPADVIVTRITELARLGRDDYEEMLRRYPEAALNMARFALRKLRRGTTKFVPEVRTIAVIPLNADVPITEFGRRLELALLRFGSTLYLDAQLAREGRPGVARFHQAQASGEGGEDLFLDRLLDQAERARRFVICEADADISEWTRKCVSHADRVVFVADATNIPRMTPVEEAFRDRSFGGQFTQRQLVLLHPSRRVPPSGTADWLALRKDYQHYHVSWEGSGDFDRMARLLSGRATTLVLGGGGARGFAHIGAIRAIREAGIPIDAVGGTSMGAIIGGLVALGWADEQILQSCKHAFVDDRPLDDITIPVFSLLSGRKLARTIHHLIGDVDIEDLWQPYFCVSSNLLKSSANVHHSGRLWRAMLASAAVPGLFPPMVAEGQLYVDGGVLDNLPVGVMKRFVDGNTIAVEASVKIEYLVESAEFPTPLRYLQSRLSRHGEHVMPTLPSLLIMSTMLGGTGGVKELREGIDLHINLPMGQFDFFDANPIYEMVDIGYRHTREQLIPWMERNPSLERREELSPESADA